MLQIQMFMFGNDSKGGDDVMGINVYFSDFFNIDERVVEEYGAINISLINDLPLFVDPFLLFNSDKEEFRQIHDEMIEYLVYLQGIAKNEEKLSKGMLNALFTFSEIRQNWLGFSQKGNAGNGMGKEFAEGLFEGLKTIFCDFSENRITSSRHMEKLCLISPRVGKDKISDFTMCFTKKYILEYTERFAKEYLSPKHCSVFNVPRVYFDWETKTWATKKYYLPVYNHDYVLLTPRDILTRDDTFINRNDMIHNLEELASSVEDETLRFQLNQYFKTILERKLSKSEKEEYSTSLIKQNPELIDYYIKYKEEHKDDAIAISETKVNETQELFNQNVSNLISLLSKLGFYSKRADVHSEALERIKFLKHVIEDQEGYKLFYVNGKPITRESDLQVIYRLTWFGSEIDVNREVNNGRGPVDYKISLGKNNATLVEFKLAKNTKLKQNLEKQVEVYKKASETENAIKVILFFSESEEKHVKDVLKELGMNKDENVILIDARSDNKISASNVK